jgi:hypothetical protein
LASHGLGHIRRRGDIYYIKYYKDGKPFYESSGSKLKQVAVDLLKTRVASPVAVMTGPVKIGALLDDYVAYAKVHNVRSERRQAPGASWRVREGIAPASCSVE